jgi:hypothetical protein
MGVRHAILAVASPISQALPKAKFSRPGNDVKMRFDDDPASIATDLTDQLESRARSAIKGTGSSPRRSPRAKKILKGALFEKIR